MTERVLLGVSIFNANILSVEKHLKIVINSKYIKIYTEIKFKNAFSAPGLELWVEITKYRLIMTDIFYIQDTHVQNVKNLFSGMEI